jgi:hypothetical protein
MQYASMPSATSTRVDSSSKHIQACKVQHDLILMLSGVRTPDELHHDKMRYCMHKDEIVLCVSKPMFPDKCIVSAPAHAYPPVVTTLAGVDPLTKRFLFYLMHTAKGPRDVGAAYSELVAAAHAKGVEVPRAVDNLPYFRTVGVALGQAFASPMSGDTVASVMIGGLRTVRNGAFEVYCGDILQWYWDGEEGMFLQPTAERDPHADLDINAVVSGGDLAPGSLRAPGGEAARKRKFGEENAAWPGARGQAKTDLALVKPYVYTDRVCFFDRMRVFAKALCDARPYDMVDIMISRQSL